MAIELSEERRKRLVEALTGFYLQEFDEEISAFRAGQVLNFFLATLGPRVYNQAVQDARAFMQSRLDDLDGEVYQSESF